MADTFDKQKRSEIMRSLRLKNNNSTELKLIEIFKRYSNTAKRATLPILSVLSAFTPT